MTPWAGRKLQAALVLLITRVVKRYAKDRDAAAENGKDQKHATYCKRDIEAQEEGKDPCKIWCTNVHLISSFHHVKHSQSPPENPKYILFVFQIPEYRGVFLRPYATFILYDRIQDMEYTIKHENNDPKPKGHCWNFMFTLVKDECTKK